MNIKIEKYLSDEEIKEIITDTIKSHVKDIVGNLSVSVDKDRVFIGKLAKNLAKDGVQEIIPNFKELINEQIVNEIKNVKLSDFFFSSFGWRSDGNKVLNEVLSNNKELLDSKIKKLLQKID